MKNLFVLAFMMLCSIGTNAQLKTITGTVVDETKHPIPGVSILIKNSTRGI